MEKKSQHDADPFDDDLFDGLADSDYQIDDDLSEGAHVHDDENDVHMPDDDQEVYHYEDKEDSTKDEAAPEMNQKQGLIDRFKHTLKSGSLSDKLRAILIPLIFAGLVLAFSVYKILALVSPSSSQTAPTSQGLDVRQFIDKPKNPSETLSTQTTGQNQQKTAQNTPSKTPASNPSKSVTQTTREKTDQSREIADRKPQNTVAKTTVSNSSNPNQVVQGSSAFPPITSPSVNHAQANQQTVASAQQSSNVQTGSISRILPSAATADDQANTVQFNEQKTLQGQALSTHRTMTNASTAFSSQGQADTSASKAAIAKITAQQTQNAQKIVALQNQVHNMNRQFTDLNTRLKTLLGTLQAQVVGLKKAREVAQKVAVLNKKAQKDYSVQAMIPGRAWLKTSQGRGLSVTQGNVVPGYGVVTDIDVDNGIVRTSSGAVLSYTLGQ